ncbi:hypothetical protein [[Ruminococcus] lactaris]|nr:hypothetical protein [[Ruminococcus] lactaris]
MGKLVCNDSEKVKKGEVYEKKELKNGSKCSSCTDYAGSGGRAGICGKH